MSIESEITRLVNAKQELADWLTEQNVAVPTGALLGDLVALLGQVKTSSSTGATVKQSTLRFDTLARYAQGIPFAQAFKPGEEMRQKLLAMRRCELPLEAALAINSEVRNRAEKSAGFYRKSVDNQYLSNAKRELERLLF